MIRAYRAACARVIADYDGSIARFVGDGVLAYFGYPRAHEDDAERAVRAGLDMIAAIRPLETRAERVEARIAIATGLVVVGDLISGLASEQQAMVGDTPNIAARLQSLAEPGAVIVAASTRELLGDLFTFRSLGVRQVKGISEPIAVWAVEGGAASESRFEAVRTARSMGFVGRKAEIEFALSRQQQAWQGQGQTVLISGEAGIGKSRLVAMLCEILRWGHTAGCGISARLTTSTVRFIPSSLNSSAPPASGHRTRPNKSSTSLRRCWHPERRWPTRRR